MKTRLIRNEDIARLLNLADLDELMQVMISELQGACTEFDASEIEVRVRDGFHYQEPRVGLIEWMPAMRTGDTVTIKTVGYHPANPAMGQIPTVLSTIGVWDTLTGHLIGLVDGVFLTALRTGAASAVASRSLARSNSRVLGLIGVGAQAVTQLHALLQDFPIRQVLIADTDPEAVASFAGRVAAFLPSDVEIREAPINLLVQSADILCTATSIDVGKGPLFSDVETRPWLHVNAVGADLPGKTELPLALLERATVCPDFREQAAQEGECQQLRPEQVGPDLCGLLQAADKYEDLKEQVTVFDSTGYALEDKVAVELLLRLCDQYDLGVQVEIEATGGDPLNPYDLGDAAEARLVRLEQS